MTKNFQIKLCFSKTKYKILISESEKRDKDTIQLEKNVQIICNQLEAQRNYAYADLNKWLRKGTETVPSWMHENTEFTGAIKNLKSKVLGLYYRQ